MKQRWGSLAVVVVVLARRAWRTAPRPGQALLAGFALAASGCGFLAGIESLSGEELPTCEKGGELCWVRQLSAPGLRLLGDMAIGPGGSIGLVGAYTGTSLDGAACDLPANDSGLFAARLNERGRCQWAAFLGTTDSDRGYGQVVFGSDGDILVTAATNAPATELGCLGCETGDLSLVARLDGATGAPRWCRCFEDLTVRAIAPGDEGVFVAGYTEVASFNLGCGQRSSAGGSTSFVVRLDDTGSCFWDQTFPMTKISDLVAVDDGRVLVAGLLDGGLDAMGLCDGVPEKPRQLLLATHSADGYCLHRATFDTSASYVIPLAVALRGPYNPVMTGLFQGTVPLADPPLQSHGVDAFVTLFTPEFAVSKGAKANSQGAAEGRSVVIDSKYHVIVAGKLEGDQIDWGGGPLSPADEEAAFLVKLDPALNHVWSTSVNGLRRAILKVGVGASDEVLVAGTFRDAVKLDRVVLSPGTDYNIFVGSFHP